MPTDPKSPEDRLEEARREAHESCMEHGEDCSSSHESIDRLVQVARLVGRVEGVGFVPVNGQERREERDRLLAELEKESR